MEPPMARLAIVAAFLFSTLPFAGGAHANCYDGLKNMLEGTLEVANSADQQNQTIEPADKHHCTLAAWEEQDEFGQEPGSI